MKILKSITYLLGFTNSWNPELLTEKTILNPQIDTRANTVGFRGDTTENKRIITWSGEEIRMKFTTETQQGANQFCIWNDWYFLASNELLVKKDYLNYNDYNSWKCLNFWGDDSKFQNSHNIKNELIIPNVQIINQGFYNLQYNYRTGGTLGIQNHIFSSLPFHLIVIPKNISINISSNLNNLKYGETVDIYSSINNDSNNIQNYIDSGILQCEYTWQTYNGNEWVTLANKSYKIENLLLEPGNHKFQLSVNAKIINDNNALKPKSMIFKSNIIEININQNLQLSPPELKLLENNIQIKYLIYYNDQTSLDKNVIDYGWYRFNSDSQIWELYSNENVILLDASSSNKFCFRAKTLNGLENIDSNIINLQTNIIQHELTVKIEDFNYTSGYEYTVYDSSNQIVNNNYINTNTELIYRFENFGKYKILIKDNNGDCYFYNINLVENTNIETPQEPDQPNNEDNENQDELQTPFYQQTWFYILISSLVGIIVLLILWLVYKKIKNKS